MCQLSVDVRALHQTLDRFDLAYRCLLFRYVVTRYLMECPDRLRLMRALDRLGTDGVILGITVLDVIASWLDGSYESGSILDTYRDEVLDGIVWLITGDECHLDRVDKRIIDTAKERALGITKSQLEYVWRQDLDH